jgi:hypothetical protein
MSRPLTTIHNIETGDTETREMNDAEFADYEAIQAELADEATAKAKAEADKAAAQAKLLALGLTEADLIAMGLMPKPVEPA